MTIPELPSNSRRPVEPQNAQPAAEELKLAPIEGIGRVTLRQKSFGRRMLDTFFKGNGGVLSYLVWEVVVPETQKLVLDLVTQGLERKFYGEVRTQPRTRLRNTNVYPIARGPHVSYDQVGRPSNTIIRGPQMGVSSPRPPVRQTATIDVGEIVLETAIDAQTIAESLYETIEEYGGVTVANLKELLGQTALYTDHKWGWQTGAEFHVRRVRGGYMLDYPDPVDLR